MRVIDFRVFDRAAVVPVDAGTECVPVDDRAAAEN